jgi:pimeloyl-ACP methyl ester carboxylesterase
MDIILIPGFWLDASSWAEVAPALERAGNRVRALTLPGLE